ncbi:efflux RND transporter permease subunit [Desulfohalovibrio reitneri]|uniref:efflux RND transporter permease subunit n=1 Tax=Desulfohalovibrio reitneri TaxID=1307759 RepID=UPI0004A76F67|nr:multidrug efflux RND transporter permease subunit [Desulfohalovibrio reitneri]
MVGFFIDRPIFASVVSIVITLLGALALVELPVAQYPDITPPVVSVTAAYPGASAEVVEESVTTPIEEQINGVENMLSMSSVSSNDGTMSLDVTFETGTDLDMAAVEVQNRLALATPKLPADVTRTGVAVKKRSTSMLMAVTLHSPKGVYDNLFMNNYALINLRDELARINGVGSLQVFGSEDYSMRIWLDPSRLSRLGLTATDVINAVREQNAQAPAGQLGQPPAPDDQAFQYSVRMQGRLVTEGEFKDIILRAEPDGEVVRLGDAARVEMGAEGYNAFSRVDGEPATNLLIYLQPGANALEVSQKVLDRMEELSAAFPEGLEYFVPFDTTKFVNASIDEVVKTFAEALLLVFAVVFIFLQSFRATLVPMVAVPVSLIGVFAVFMGVGFSINTFTLFGLVLAIGLVVDDAIVVVEAVQRLIDDEGLSAREATHKAMRQVTGPIVATSLVLVAVFLPVAMMAGLTGRLFEQFGVTLALAVLISTVNALTLSPALCALLLGPRKEAGGLLGRFFGVFNAAFAKFTSGYSAGVQGLLRRGVLAVVLLAIFFGAAAFLQSRLPSGFLPQEDQGYFIVSAQLPEGAALRRTDAMVAKLEDYLTKADGVDHIMSLGGMNILDSSQTSYNAALFVTLTDWDERLPQGLTLKRIIAGARAHFAGIKDGQAMCFIPPSIPGLGSTGGFTMELQDSSGRSIDEFQEVAGRFIGQANQRPEVGFAYTTFSTDVPRVRLDLDRDKAKMLGVPLTEIFSSLQTFLGGYYANDFTRFGRNYKVMLQAESGYRSDVSSLGDFHVRNEEGDMVSMESLVSAELTSGPESISHYNVYRSISINGQAASGYSSGQALAGMEAAAESLPPGYGFEWTGTAYQEKLAAGKASGNLALAVVMVFLFLAALYESWTIPFAVLLAVPFGVLGAAGAQLLRGLDFDVYGQIGLVMLIGLVAKNAILIVEFAKMRQEEGGLPPDQAALEAAKLRFRAILMTSLSFILGVVPLVVASGAGAASRHALGTAVFGGMISAVVLATLFVPSLYTLIRRLAERVRPAKGPK